MATALAAPEAIASPATAALPDLAARALAVYLSGLAALSALPIAMEKVGTAYQRPVLVVGSESSSERIYQSGTFQVTLVASLETGPKTTDATLEAWDGVLWNQLLDTAALPGLMAAAQPGLNIYAAVSPGSRPTAFDEKQRDIAYHIDLVCAKVAVA